MKKVVLVMLALVGLFAKSSMLSPLPLPDKIFIDLEPGYCDKVCLEQLAQNEMYFSFLAKYAPFKNKDELDKTYEKVTSLFNIKPLDMDFYYDFSKESVQVKLAILLCKNRIKNYATTSVNSIIAYLMARNSAFDIEVFDVENENPEELQSALEKIREKGYKAIVAPVTLMGANYISQNVSDLLVFIPTMHNSSIVSMGNNILYGGIDYNEQVKTLLGISNQKIATFSDESGLSSRIDSYVAINTSDIVYSNQISGKKINLKYISDANMTLQNSSVFLNMSLVKSSLLSSQLRSFDVDIYALLSTQINYNPLLLTLTQPEDVKKLYIANSIGDTPFEIRANNELFNHSIEYDWVNYATNIGIDYIYANFYADQNSSRVFNEPINGNQISYQVKIMKPTGYGFKKVD